LSPEEETMLRALGRVISRLARAVDVDMIRERHRAGDAQHYGTAVLPEHRGHGLARWIKAESIRQARDRHPELSGLLTDTADNNQPMRRINDALGYRPTHQTRRYKLDLRTGG
jgi:GNAT superfamily N-acetyltransferase